MAGTPLEDAADGRLLVLGAGPAQIGLLRAAQELGLHTIAVDRDPSAPGFRFASRRAIVSTEDELNVERLADAERVDGLVSPGADWPVAVAARVAERLGLPHPISPQTAVLATSKLRQRERFTECGVPQPRYAVCRSADEADDAVREIGFPCVVKAPDRQGQKGLTLVGEPGELDAAIQTALAAARSGLVLIEELIEGPEVTVNCFWTQNSFTPLTVTDRNVSGPPAFGVALAHVWPPERADGAVEAARAASAALGIEDGPVYVQLRLGPNGPQVVELAARVGGGHDAELCKAALGVDLNALTIRAALGEPIEPPQPEPQVGGAVVRFLVAPPGPLQEVAGLEQAEAVEGVRWVRVYREPGYVFVPLRRGADRAGAILAVGDSAADALARADRAAERVRFVTADAGALVET
ncbi:MAG TPA: ATP-grasp domain-containing protein [Gaiellaceae bacterium]|nr:ATP-grasp domain-containing protein [Gaiellaceae bacterium]